MVQDVKRPMPTQSPGTTWVGWFREGKSPWVPVCSAPTFASCWVALLAWPTAAPLVERAALPTGKRPRGS